jgi:hypothetical protein
VPLLPAAPAPQPAAAPIIPAIRTESTVGVTQPVSRLLEPAGSSLPPLSSPPLSS